MMINENESFSRNDFSADNDGSFDDCLFDFSQLFEVNELLIDKKMVDENAIQSKSSEKITIQQVYELPKIQFNPLMTIKKINYNYFFNLAHKRQRFLHFPHFSVKIPDSPDFQIYNYLYKLTGAYLSQNELIILRQSIFKDVLPPILRDEQRSKIKNIECLEKYKKQLIPILQTPKVQYSIQNYIFSRRNQSQKIHMLNNIQNQIKESKDD